MKAKLTDICRPKQWKTISMNQLLNNGYPVYGANGKIGYYSEYTHEKSTLLITCRGATCGTVNISEPFSYVNGNAMALDNIDSTKADIYFLYYYFLYRGFSDVISGSAQPQITRQGLEKVVIDLPEINKQKRIVQTLDVADGLRQKRKEQLKLLDDYLKSVFFEMFGDPVRNDKGWRISPVKSYALVKIGPFGSLLHKKDYVHNGIPLINPKHIIDKKIIEDPSCSITPNKHKDLFSYHLKQGDVILGRRGEIGRCALITEKQDGFLCGTGSMFIRPDNTINGVFLIYLISTEQIMGKLENSAKGITMKNLNAGIVQDLELPIPRIELQRKFASIVEQVKRAKQKMRESLDEMDNHFNAIMQSFFG